MQEVAEAINSTCYCQCFSHPAKAGAPLHGTTHGSLDRVHLCPTFLHRFSWLLVRCARLLCQQCVFQRGACCKAANSARFGLCTGLHAKTGCHLHPRENVLQGACSYGSMDDLTAGCFGGGGLQFSAGKFHCVQKSHVWKFLSILDIHTQKSLKTAWQSVVHKIQRVPERSHYQCKCKFKPFPSYEQPFVSRNTCIVQPVLRVFDPCLRVARAHS